MQSKIITASSTNDGFTLIELLTVISILVIILAIATPSFIEIRRNSELTKATNTLIATLNNARSEAMNRGVNVIVAPTDNANWASGVTAYIDKNYDQTLTTADMVIVKTEELPSYFTVKQSNTAAKNFIQFNGSGFARTSSGVNFSSTVEIARNDISDKQLSLTQIRRIKVSVTGRIYSCKPVSLFDPLCS
jgi:type IV fimbrial biogenesis protein FimT